MQGVIPIGVLYVLKLLVDEVVLLHTNGLTNLTDTQLPLYLFLIVLLNIINGLLTISLNFVNDAQQQRFTDNIQSLLNAKFSTIDYSFYENPDYQNRFHKAQREALSRPNGIIMAITTIIQNIIMAAGVSILLFSLNKWILPLLVIIMLPASFIHTRYSKRKNKWALEKSNLDRKSFYFSHLLKDIIYAKEIRVFNFFGDFERSFQEIRKQLFSEKLKINGIQAKSLVLVSIIEAALLGGIYYYIIHQSILGAISVGSLVMYFQAFQKGQTTIKAGLRGVTELMEHQLFLEQLFEFLELKSQTPTIDQPTPFPSNIQCLKLENVSFRYSPNSRMVLNAISTEFKKGEITAIVGSNGSGKSSLAKLICRIYETTKGELLVDNVSFKEMSIDEVRRNTSIIFQDYSKFFLTAKQNITGKTEGFSTQKLNDAITSSGATEIIEKLPKGVDTFLGRHFVTGGSELSGGEWQRIAISRAYYKDSPILILDEPTTFIDGIMENHFLNALQKLKENKILILISHKVSNIEIADKVIMLKDGAIANHGTHAFLKDSSKDYRRLLNI